MREEQLGGPSVPNDRMLKAPGTKGGVGHQTGARRGISTSPYLTHSALVVPYAPPSPVPNEQKRRGRERPHPKAGDHAAPIAALCHMPLSGPMGVGRSRPH